MKKNTLLVIVVLVLIILIILLSKSPQKNNPDVISKKGIHWHPELVIYINGEAQEIPENIGLGAVHNPVHTHEDLPIIHLEFGGLVKNDDVRLGQFFKAWDKDINSFGTLVKMQVDGVENNEFENYMMRDGNKIELWYE